MNFYVERYVIKVYKVKEIQKFKNNFRRKK